MLNPSCIKEKLFQSCLKHIDERIATIRQTLDSIEESRNNESKSSVGDKYETGRAMMQIEEEKCRAQLANANDVKIELLSVNNSRPNQSAGLGNLVTTDNGTYYISIGIGKVMIDDRKYYCISKESPIAIAMRNAQTGDRIEFNGKKITIINIG